MQLRLYRQTQQQTTERRQTMKTKMLTITMILTVLIMWTGGSAWAKNNRGPKHRQEVKAHKNHDKRVGQRHENRSHRADKYQVRRPDHRHGKWNGPAHRYQNRHHQPRRPVYRHRDHHHKHHNSGFLFGLSIYEPGQAFSIVLGDRH